MASIWLALALLLSLSLSAEGRHASTYEWVEAEDAEAGRSLTSAAPKKAEHSHKGWDPIRKWCIPDLNASYFCTGATLESFFSDNQIVPDLLSKHDIEYDVGVKVAFPGRLDVIGTFVNRSIAAAAPNVTFSRASSNFKLLTLIMLDPDASSRWNASSGPILHWLVTNINNSDVSTGTVVQPFRQPSPAPGNGIHRYTLLLLDQTTHARIDVPLVNQTDPAARRNFNLYKLLDTYKLAVIGGSFFFSAAN